MLFRSPTVPKTPFVDLAVDALIENFDLKEAIAGEIFGAELSFRKNTLIMGDLDSGAVHDVAHRINGDQLDVPSSLGENNGRFIGCRGLAVAKIPEVLICVLGVVGEFDPKVVAERVDVRVVVNGGIGCHGGLKVNFDDAQIAVVAHSGRGDYASGCREGTVAAGGTYGLVNGPIRSKAGGAPIYVLGRSAPKKGGVENALRILLEHHKIEIAAVRGGLHGIRGNGQVVGIAAQIAAVYRATPARKKDVEAFVYIKCRGDEVDKVVGRTKLAGEN